MTTAGQVIAAGLQLLIALIAFLSSLGFLPGGSEINAALVAALASVNSAGSSLQARNGGH